jgi:hypothetical protein
MQHQVATDYTQNVSIEKSNVKVFVRARPPEDGKRPPTDIYQVYPEMPKKITIKDPDTKGAAGGTSFAFDRVKRKR